MTHRERMEQGLWHDANYDQELVERRKRAEELCFSFNQTAPGDVIEKKRILGCLLPNKGENVTILAPFYTDYGDRCWIGGDTFLNHNAYLMDGGGIHIGAHCFIGPNCGMYTANHPLHSDQRNQGFEQAKPIVLEDNVWLGGNVTILPGVTIGEGSVIGAGSVVTHDIPKGFVAVGNPCRVLRPITDRDRIPEEELQE